MEEHQLKNNQLDVNNYMKKDDKKSDAADKALQDLLSSAVVKHISEEQNKQLVLQKECQMDMEHLPSVLGEYLKNYVVIAHDILGNEVVFSYAASPNDKNAVMKLFHDTFIRMMVNPNNPK
jgi:hypothetical protein